MTFRERYLLGEAEFEEIFDLTDEWNFSDTTETLRTFLGLTEEEEDVWISESDDALEELMERERRQRIFFTDLDDTLLCRDKHLSEGNLAALRRLLTEGHILVLSTGRPAASTRVLAKQLGLNKENCYALCYNGAEIVRLSDMKTVSASLVSAEDIALCTDAAREFGIHIQTYSKDHVLVHEENDIVAYYTSFQPISDRIVSDFTAELPDGSPKMLAVDLKNPERTNAFQEVLQEKVGDRLDLFHSCPEMLEIVPKGINKGTALKELCNILGIPVQHSVSAGDNENDLPLIREAGIGCAMANAIDVLKESADYVTQSDCDHDGIQEILEKFIF